MWPLYSITDVVYNDVGTKDHGMASSNEGSGVLNDIYCSSLSLAALFSAFITIFSYMTKHHNNVLIHITSRK